MRVAAERGDAVNIPDAGRAPSNEPEPPRLEGHDARDMLHCVKCNAVLMLDPDACIECPRCGPQSSKQVREALAAMRKRWPPPSQEARAASTGQTRTK